MPSPPPRRERSTRKDYGRDRDSERTRDREDNKQDKRRHRSRSRSPKRERSRSLRRRDDERTTSSRRRVSPERGDLRESVNGRRRRQSPTYGDGNSRDPPPRSDRRDRERNEDRERGQSSRDNQFQPDNRPQRREDSSRSAPIAAKPSIITVSPAKQAAAAAKQPLAMIEVIANDRLGGKVRVKCSPDDTVGDLKKLIAAQKGTKPEKIVLKKWYTIYKDHIKLSDYEIHNGMSLELH